MEVSGQYSPLLRSWIDHVNDDAVHPPEFDQDPTLASIKCALEIERILRDRPVVVLAKGTTQVCYRRPGAPQELELALFHVEDQTLTLPKFDPAKHSFLQHDIPPRLSKHPSDLTALMKTCHKMGLLRELYLEIVTHEMDYYDYRPPIQANRAGTLIFSPLGFSECACAHSFRLESNRRKVLEEQFVQHILQVKPRRDELIRVVSIGSGSLLPDWKMIGLLIKEGYSKFEWVVVDQQYPDLPELARFQAFYQKIPDIKMNIVAYSEISVAHKALLERQFKADALCAIDFNPGPMPLVDTHDLLSAHAKVFFGYRQHDFIISKDETVSLHGDTRSSIICKEVDKILPRDYTGELHIACAENISQLAHLIAHIRKSTTATLKVTIGNCHQTEKEISSCFKFFFPSMQVTVESVTCPELYEKVRQGTKFDLVIHEDVDDASFGKMYGSFVEQKDHLLGESSTVFLLREEDDLFTHTYKPTQQAHVEELDEKKE